eukprot:3354281-Rhodomonas_salina.1
MIARALCWCLNPPSPVAKGARSRGTPWHPPNACHASCDGNCWRSSSRREIEGSRKGILSEWIARRGTFGSECALPRPARPPPP